MFGSFPIARLFGTTVRIDLSWVILVLATALFWPGDALGAVLNLLMVFSLVVLHEFGHTLAARAFGIEVLDITLWFLGGMARMREIPEKPKVEALIALAGPAVNFALAAIALPVLVLTGLFDSIEVGIDFTGSIAGLLLNFILINLFMGASNLVPAFPMDGGRVFRAVAALFTDWLTATRIAAGVGKMFAVIAIVCGFIWSQWSLAAVGMFVWLAASREVWAVHVRRAQRQAQEAGFGGFPPGTGPRPAVFTPVEKRPESAPESAPDDASGARRPVENPLEPGARLDDDAVRRLEQFRGPLRGPTDREE